MTRAAPDTGAALPPDTDASAGRTPRPHDPPTPRTPAQASPCALGLSRPGLDSRLKSPVVSSAAFRATSGGARGAQSVKLRS